MGETDLNPTFIFTPDIYLGIECGEVISNYMTLIGVRECAVSLSHL